MIETCLLIENTPYGFTKHYNEFTLNFRDNFSYLKQWNKFVLLILWKKKNAVSEKISSLGIAVFQLMTLFKSLKSCFFFPLKILLS